MRFDVRWIDSHSGRERLGTLTNYYMTYANLRNVIRFGLAKPALPAGQYNIYDDRGTLLTTAYKRA